VNVVTKKDIKLRINSIDWIGWTSFEISMKVDEICPQFAFGLVELNGPSDVAKPIAAGMPCEVVIKDEVILMGYIDKVDYSIGPSQHATSISGRGKQADLVDCSAMNSPGEWKGLRAIDLLRELADPLGVPVFDDGADQGEVFEAFKLEDGETAFEAMDRVLKQRELILVPDVDGGLLLTKTGQKKASVKIEQGVNIQEAAGNYDVSNRFSDYIVEGQMKGSDGNYGVSCSQVEGAARDESVERYRPMLVRAENQVDTDSAVKRAKWEASTRAARSVTIGATLRGWYQGDEGGLWKVNELVDTDIFYLRIKQELLITSVTFSLTLEAGTTTKLELKDPRAFEPEPPKKEKASGGKGQSKPRELQQESAENAWAAHKDA
jgi:prophage tail gpP-like protein